MLVKRLVLVAIFICPECNSQPAFPYADISNGIVHARLYSPDAKKGYYRSTRFDWSGIMPMLEYRGHSYFGQWFQTHDAQKHDAVCGPVEEFDPIGYEDADTGGTFLKIGVGTLRKPVEEKYDAFTFYEIIDRGKWVLKKKPGGIEFEHRLKDSAGHSYLYVKKVTLTPGKPELVIAHNLKNTGKKRIVTMVYNHNFFMIDSGKTDSAIVFKASFDLQGEGRGLGDIAKIQNNQINFLRSPGDMERVYIRDLKGYRDDPNDYDFRIENLDTGAGVRIKGDRPIEKLVFWASPATYCPEPYIRISVEPGQEFSWQNTYEFYEF